MAKLEAEIEALRARAAVLESRAQDAQLALDRALVERQTFLLSGDLDDNGRGDKLQRAVDTAPSKLSGRYQHRSRSSKPQCRADWKRRRSLSPR